MNTDQRSSSRPAVGRLKVFDLRALLLTFATSTAKLSISVILVEDGLLCKALPARVAFGWEPELLFLLAALRWTFATSTAKLSISVILVEDGLLCKVLPACVAFGWEPELLFLLAFGASVEAFTFWECLDSGAMIFLGEVEQCNHPNSRNLSNIFF